MAVKFSAGFFFWSNITHSTLILCFGTKDPNDQFIILVVEFKATARFRKSILSVQYSNPEFRRQARERQIKDLSGRTSPATDEEKPTY